MIFDGLNNFLEIFHYSTSYGHTIHI
jgi:hypothetical protein